MQTRGPDFGYPIPTQKVDLVFAPVNLLLGWGGSRLIFFFFFLADHLE